MKSVFNHADNSELIERINKINPNKKALWGKMSASQMFVHLQIITKLAIGEINLKRGLLGVLFGPIAKMIFIRHAPFPKNLMTDKSFVVADLKEFEIEKNKLIDLIKKFKTIDKNSLNKTGHPIFGKLTPAEWDTLQWKHCDHHLRQFGV